MEGVRVDGQIGWIPFNRERHARREDKALRSIVFLRDGSACDLDRNFLRGDLEGGAVDGILGLFGFCALLLHVDEFDGVITGVGLRRFRIGLERVVNFFAVLLDDDFDLIGYFLSGLAVLSPDMDIRVGSYAPLGANLCPCPFAILTIRPLVRVHPHVDFVVSAVAVDKAHLGKVEGQFDFMAGCRAALGQGQDCFAACRLRIDRQNPVIICRAMHICAGADTVGQGSAILVFDVREGDGVGSAAGVRHDQVVGGRLVFVEDRGFLRKACCAIAGRARDLEVRELRGVFAEGDGDGDVVDFVVLAGSVGGRHGCGQRDFSLVPEVLCCGRIYGEQTAFPVKRNVACFNLLVVQFDAALVQGIRIGIANQRRVVLILDVRRHSDCVCFRLSSVLIRHFNCRCCGSCSAAGIRCRARILGFAVNQLKRLAHEFLVQVKVSKTVIIVVIIECAKLIYARLDKESSVVVQRILDRGRDNALCVHASLGRSAYLIRFRVRAALLIQRILAGPEEVLALHLIDLAVLVDRADRFKLQHQFIVRADAGQGRLAVRHAALDLDFRAVLRLAGRAVIQLQLRHHRRGFLQRERQRTKLFAVERRLDRDRARLSRLVDDELVVIADGHACIRAVQRNGHVRRRRRCPFWHRLFVRLKEVLHNDRERLVFRRAVGDIDRRDRPTGEFIAVHIAQHDRRSRRLRIFVDNLELKPIAI